MTLRAFLSSIFVVELGAAALGCASTVASGGAGGEKSDGGSGGEGHGGQAGAGGSSTTSASSTTSTSSGGPGSCSDICDVGDCTDPCTPGDTVQCPGVPDFEDACPPYTATCGPAPDLACTGWNADPSCGCSTPLVLSFDGAPVEYLVDREHAFDLNGARSQVTDWPTARTPWLVMDRDDSGTIEDGGELFGSMTVLSSGRRARQGFEALRELDANGDGRITPEDPAFGRLLVWSDRDGDRVSSPGELTSLAALGIVSIDLAFTVDPRCDARGNCEVERASLRYIDSSGVEQRGAVVDVHIAVHR